MRIDPLLQEVRGENRNFLSSPAEGEYEQWSIKRSGVIDYSHYFNLLLSDKEKEGGGMLSLFRERKESGRHTVTLELMGYGNVLMELRDEGVLDGGIAVALSDIWTYWREGRNAKPYTFNPLPQEVKEGMATIPLDIIAGDVLSKRTWRALAQ